MEKKVTYGVMLSLQEISLRNVTTLLWTQPQISASLDKIGIESVVKYNMKELTKFLPTKFLEQISILIKPIGDNLRIWKKFHEKYLKIGNINMLSFVNQLRWSWSVGIVDYGKTAENLIRCKMFDNVKLYKLACLYCLEEDIRFLWEKLPIESKIYFFQGGPSHIENLQLEFYWPFVIEDKETVLEDASATFRGQISFNQFLFNNSVHACNKAAAQYFFQKLPTHLRNDALSSIIKDAFQVFMPFTDRRRIFRRKNDFSVEKKSDIFIYLVSLMKPEQQREIFQAQYCQNLKNFLEWPWQDLFLDITNFT